MQTKMIQYNKSLINENKKNQELVMEKISELNNKMNQGYNGIINKEIKFDNGDKYFGKVVNDKPEGKGIFYFKNGDRYEGDFKDGKKEGRGILYYNNGERYEGDFKNDTKEGKGIRYYINGDREIGDFLCGEPIGTHAILTSNGDVKSKKY